MNLYALNPGYRTKSQSDFSLRQAPRPCRIFSYKPLVQILTSNTMFYLKLKRLMFGSVISLLLLLWFVDSAVVHNAL